MSPTWKAAASNEKQYILHPHHKTIVSELPDVDEVKLPKASYTIRYTAIVKGAVQTL